MLSKQINFNNDAMEALVVSEKLYSHSSDMMHNAYQGKTLQEATRGEFKSFDISRATLLKASGGLIQTKNLERIYQAANNIVKEIVLKYNLEIESNYSGFKKYCNSVFL